MEGDEGHIDDLEEVEASDLSIPQRRRWVWLVPFAALATLAVLVALVGGAVRVIGERPERSDPLSSPVVTSRACAESSVAVIVAADAGRRDEVQTHLAGIDPDHTDRSGNSALACAGAKGHEDVVRLLLDAGADPDTVARDGDTVLADAVQFCQIGVLRLLLAAGADPDEGGQMTPVDHAWRRGAVEAVEALLEAGAAPEVRNQSQAPTERGRDCDNAVATSQSAALQTLFDRGADPDAVLRAAVTYDLWDVAAVAVGQASHPDLDIDPSGEDWGLERIFMLGCPDTTPLAVCHPVTGLVRITEGPEAARNVFPTSPDDDTGVDPDSTATAEPPVPVAPTTALMHAAWAGDIGLVEAALAAGADPNLVSVAGFTPLHAAAGAGHAEVVAVLAPVTASPAGTSEFSPSAVACLAGHDDLATTLEAAAH